MPLSQNRKLGFKNLGKIFSRFSRFPRYSSFRPGLLKLRFTVDIVTNVPFEYERSQLEQSIIDEEVLKLIQKKIIITTYVQEGDFFSNLFI